MACKCVNCDWCHGSGHVWITGNGEIVRNRCDDDGDLYPCPECNGSGLAEECEECFAADNDDDFDLFLGGM